MNDSLRTPRQRWGTCCPFDPECEHSFLDDIELERWMDSPISDYWASSEGPSLAEHLDIT